MKERGWKVSTIKHHFHGDFEPDTPGKDSHRHYQSGAEGVLLASPKKIAYFEKIEDDEIPSIDKMMHHFPKSTTLILMEGFHKRDYPRIEISRSEISTELLSGAGDELIAVIADHSPDVSCPVFALNNIKSLADYLDEYLKNRGYSK
jgi:molybdopterin-guanine dinucleotide biosynthesis protein MobB